LYIENKETDMYFRIDMTEDEKARLAALADAERRSLIKQASLCFSLGLDVLEDNKASEKEQAGPKA
jgi:hypothetical protein